MFLIRNVFQAKPGKAKVLVKIMKEAVPFLEPDGFSNIKIMTDIVGDYWTVVLQSEVESLDIFEKNLRGSTSQPAVAEIMKDYMENVIGGHREIFKIE